MPSKKRNADVSNEPLCTSDREIYAASETEEEEYSCDSDDIEWEVDKIHGIEIDLQGKRRYEVQWKDWQRSDGSSTTWEYLHGEDSDEVRKSWEDSFDDEALRRTNSTARGGLIFFPCRSHEEYLPHTIRTAEAYDAYEKQLEHHGDKQAEAGKSWDTEITSLRSRHLDGGARPGPAQAARPRSESVGSIIITASGRRKRKRKSSMSSDGTSYMSAPSIAGSSMSTSSVAGSVSSTRSIKRETSMLSIDTGGGGSGSTSVKARLPSTRPTTSKFRRQRQIISPQDTLSLARHWTQAAFAVGAAEIEIVNEVDDEECPRLSEDFKYLENECRYGEGVKHPSEFSSFMFGCSCLDDCRGPLSCDCQANANVRNEEGDLQRAYDDNALFLFNNCGAEVVECNDKCGCSLQCKNRVAQKPRDIPLVIFKTKSNGWGVRCRERIPRGKVLGIYTGEIITREAADQIRPSEHTYLFNLDTRDATVEENLDFYTVDATRCGNWTRFINHSCNPNASVYSVVYDNILETNMPYLAIVASQDIAPGVEITFDYDPSRSRSAAENLKLSQEKASQESRSGCLVVCKCESANCRGMVF